MPCSEEDLAVLEAETTLIRGYHPAAFGPLLQLPEYARQVVHRSNGGLAAEPDAVIELRTRRQAILADAGRRFDFILTEAALRAQVCSADVLQAQWEHLAMLSLRANVDIRVLPLDAELPAVVPAGFVICDSRAVEVETLTGHDMVTDAAAIAIYARTFAVLKIVALSGDDARQFLDIRADDTNFQVVGKMRGRENTAE